MNKNDIIQEVTQKTKQNKEDVRKVINLAFDTIRQAIRNGKRVAIPNIKIAQPKRKKRR